MGDTAGQPGALEAPSPPAPRERPRRWFVDWRLTLPAALAIAVLWGASLGLPALEMQMSPAKWYDGGGMFLGGLIGQAFIYPSLAGVPTWYLAWWSNLALFAVVFGFLLGHVPRLWLSFLPLALALFAFTITKFGLPDDEEGPVIAHGAGFWLWLAAMAVAAGPWVAREIIRRRRPAA